MSTSIQRNNHCGLLQFENQLKADGFRYICGIDEAGRGPLAGPVVAAAFLIDITALEIIGGVYDSKKCSAKKRAELLPLIQSQALSYSYGSADHEEIDRINIYQASRLAMKRAVEGLTVKPEYCLIDAMNPDILIPHWAIKKGDQKSYVIAAASILAKEYRDNLMRKLDEEFPEYQWKKNKGYPTATHRKAVQDYGFSPYHRRTFHIKPN